MRILVVEDTQSNIAAARKMLADHELTIATGYDDALATLTPKLDEQLALELLKDRLPEGWRCSEFVRRFPKFVDPAGEECIYDLPVEIRRVWNQVERDASPAPFDVVLTDVMIPKGGDRCMSDEGASLARRQGPMPYGPVIALRAVQIGIKRIGILTSGSHHHDPFVFAFDGLEGFSAGDVKLYCSNHIDTENDGFCAKDWARMLNALMR
jgi:CheY-like chemotaxis protein